MQKTPLGTPNRISNARNPPTTSQGSTNPTDLCHGAAEVALQKVLKRLPALLAKGCDPRGKGVARKKNLEARGREGVRGEG